MSGGNRSYIDKAELSKMSHIECMKHLLAVKNEFLAREATCEAVWPHVSCSITTL